MYWRVVANSDLAFATWESDRILVYHSASGNTHILTEPAVELLKTLNDHPDGLLQQTMIASLAERLNIIVDDEFSRFCISIADELANNDMIEAYQLNT